MKERSNYQPTPDGASQTRPGSPASFGTMSDIDGIVPAKRKPSFFSVAAWMSLIIPFATLGVVIAISSLSGHIGFLPSPSRQFTGDLHGSALLTDFGSFVLGFLSMFGIRRHGAAFILWKAVPGIIASGVLGFCHFALMMLSSITC